MEDDIEHKQSEEQSKFRAGRSTIDTLHTKSSSTKTYLMEHGNTYSSDLEKAYNSVPVPQLQMEMSVTSLIQAVQTYYM